jgi:hypothetical protein
MAINSRSTAQPPAAQHTWLRRIKAAFAVLLVTVGCISFGAYVVVHWTESQILNTDKWVELVSPLPKQPVVSTALGSFISDKVFTEASVEQKISDALPPKAGFLAGPLAGQLKTLTTRASQRLVAGNAFQTIWSGANRAAMGRLLANARGQPTPLQSRISQRFNVDISGTSGQLQNALGKASAAIPALQPAADKALAVSADLHQRPRRIHQVIRTMDFLAAVLPWAVVASVLGALAFSGRRRLTGQWTATTVIVLMLVELIALKWGRQQTLEQVHNPGNLSAVSYIYDVLIGGLKTSIGVVIVAMLIVLVLLLLAGPARWAQALRDFVRLDRLRRSGIAEWLHAARLWVRRWEYYMWLVAAVLVLAAIALFTDEVSSRIIVNGVLLMISLFALLHIIATPHRSALA